MHNIRHVFFAAVEKSWNACTLDPFLIFIPFLCLRSVTDFIRKCRLRLKDGRAEKVGTNDKRVFIQLNGLPSGFKEVYQKFFKSSFIIYVWFY